MLFAVCGAQVRDGAAWASYITEAITRYGNIAEITFQSHNWPHWGNDVINNYLVNTAAVYKFINDQTLTYINQGYTSDEISNMIKLPDKLAKTLKVEGNTKLVALLAENMNQVPVTGPSAFNIIEP